MVKVIGVLAINPRAPAQRKVLFKEMTIRSETAAMNGKPPDKKKVVMAGFEPARSPNSALSCRLNHSATSPDVTCGFFICNKCITELD